MSLDGFYQQWDERGLILAFTLYEDSTGGVVSSEFASEYAERLGLSYPLYQDPLFVMHPYYPDNSVPLSLVISTEDMVIRYKETGYEDSEVTYWARKFMEEDQE